MEHAGTGVAPAECAEGELGGRHKRGSRRPVRVKVAPADGSDSSPGHPPPQPASAVVRADSELPSAERLLARVRRVTHPV